MKRLPFYLLVLFFVVLYTHGLWRSIGLPKLMVDGVLLVLPVVILLCQPGALRRPPPGFLFVWFYLGWSLSACIYNDEGMARGLLYPRFLITSYLVFWAVWSSRFTHRQLLQINTVIFILFFLQVAAASYFWLVLHQQAEVEAIVGTMGSETGGIATTFPMFAFSCMLAFFLYYNRPMFLLAGFSFFIVGHASGKLATYYFLPLLLVVGFVVYAATEGTRVAIRRGRVIVLIGACLLPFLVFLMTNTHRTMSLQRETGIYNKIVSFFELTQRVALEDRSWHTTTRAGTSRRVLQETFSREPSVFLFGQGTHVFLDMSGQPDAGAYDKYGIIYGIVGWSADALAAGWPVMFAHVGFYSYLFYLLLRNGNRGALNPYWKSIRLTVELGFCVFLLSYFLYCTFFTTGSWISSVYLYFLAVLLAPQYQEIRMTRPIERVDERTLRFRRRGVPAVGGAGVDWGDLTQDWRVSL